MKLLSIFAAFLFISHTQAQSLYPVPKKIPQVETRFGVQIEDPYKWMENPNDPDLWNWIEEEKSFTTSYLDASLMDEFAKRTLEVRKLREEQGKVTEKSLSLLSLDFHDLYKVEEGKQHLKKWSSRSSLLKAFSYQKESSLYKIRVQTVHSGDLFRVIISKKSDNSVVDILLVKFYTFITWADDNSFYYVSDLDERIGGGRPGLFRHTVGDIQSEDQLLLSGKTASSDLTVHEIGQKFFVEADGTVGTLQLSAGKVTNKHPINGEIVEMTEAPEAVAIIRSFEKANFGEFHKLRLRDGQRTVLLREQDFVVEKTKKLTDNETLVIGLKDASHVAGILNADGSLKMIEALQNATIEFKDFKGNELRLNVESYTHPRKVYSYNLENGELKVTSSQTLPFEVDAEKIYYKASNGQDASLWVFKKKGLVLTKTTPVILYGYGGFRSSITPAFGMYESLPWIEKGGAFAVVTLPGSLDYGISWYNLAKVGGRTHSFDSFALAAKELFRRGWTSAEHIGMMGASNGGTLVAGTLQRHSDIFKAAVPIVGVMDLLNFTLFTAGKYWTEDYGNPFIENDFRAIFPLSPYHNIEKRNYPATMVMTAEFDDRVVPMHSYKYAARLQEYNTSDAPILLYNKEWGAHGRASGSARESSRFVAAFYTFFAQQLGL